MKVNSTNHYKERIRKAVNVIDQSEFVLIGAGAGLSEAAGLKYSGTRFTERFSDFIGKYRLVDMYTAGFYPFETKEEKWAYWARHIFMNRYEPPAAELYKRVYELAKEKNYFVITTNVDHQFWKAGFPEERVFATQGDYGHFQCEKGCHDKVYENEGMINEMLRQTKNCRIPSNLVPKCPICGSEMEVNLRKDDNFIQDLVWYQAVEHYKSFLKASEGKTIVFLELGVGYNTPGIIRYPFEQMTYENHNATIIRLNRDHPSGATPNKEKTISFHEDMMMVINSLMEKEASID